MALEMRRHQAVQVEDSCKLFCRSESGVTASINLSWSISKQSPYYLSVYGSARMLQVGWQGSHYRQSDKLEWVEFGSGYDKFQAVGDQLRNFIQTIRKRAQPLIASDAAIDSVRLIQAAYRSLGRNHWERIGA